MLVASSAQSFARILRKLTVWQSPRLNLIEERCKSLDKWRIEKLTQVNRENQTEFEERNQI